VFGLAHRFGVKLMPRIRNWKDLTLFRPAKDTRNKLPRTPMLTGSITRSFTALAFMQLVEAGKLDLHAPIQRYQPWFRIADADASTRMTVRHLLNQTSGFPTFPSDAGMVGGDMEDGALEHAVRSLASTWARRIRI
jgi:CubicO group peptidase (beta-lactamase class C family)